MINKRILIATGNSSINDSFEEHTGYNIIGSAMYSDDLEKAVSKFQPDIILTTEMLKGSKSVNSVLLQIKSRNPDIRIIYVIGKLDLKSLKQVDSLGLLIMSGIYDIVIEPKITIDMLKRAIDNKKTEDDVSYILNASSFSSNNKGGNKGSNIEFILPTKDNFEDESLKRNLYAISSVKPGTGKSFVSVNTATAIAEYGVKNSKGEPPKVGLIEADLQNLSLGTLLNIESKDKNVKTAMEKISEIVNEKGELHGDARKIQEVNEFVKSCFIPYEENKNLFALVGSHLAFEELENINRFHYIYLIEAVIDEFDVLIVDTNSALTHTTTYPVLQIAESCYYVLNIDYNNARNNARYRDTLKRMGLEDKVKYVLNEDITEEMEKEYDESVLFKAKDLEDAGFKLEAKIPAVPKPIFLNHLYKGLPLILDTNKKNQLAREEIMKVANQMYPLKGFNR